MSVLTTSQLTFCDLKDSYSIYIDTECIAVACDNNGLASSTQFVHIHYHILAGSTFINTHVPEVLDLPSGVTVTGNKASTSGSDGDITIKIAQFAELNNKDAATMKVVFTTNDSEQFVFEKYITFVKSMKGIDGTDAVDFQIYSVDGFEFSDELTSIELKTVAFQGGSAIETGATYQWWWWNSFSKSYEQIQKPDTESPELMVPVTSNTLIVKASDAYAFSELKCVMSYDNRTYEDHVFLTKKTTIYTSVVKFFDGSNIFTANDLYIVAYIELYQNNDLVESALDFANSYCTGVSSISNDGIIITDLTGNFADGDRIYFVCKNENLYKVVLGEYVSNKWYVVDNSCKYAYTNSLYPAIQSNIIAISKESINKAQNIDFFVHYNNKEISRTNVNIIDSNDPIISDSAPENPTHNQLWLDTSTTPSTLKIYDSSDGVWLECADYVGNVVYTSKPSSYKAGDLWILADGEVCGNFGPGSMVKAITSSDYFDESHWIDADRKMTELKENINQYFAFNRETGLKIGQVDENFYVNISSTEMGFYDNSDGQNQKVVSIGNKSATIKNIIVEDGAEFNCDVTFNSEVNFFGFVWKQESNGSLSLAIGN